MKVKTVERDGRIYVSVNDVESPWAAMPDGIGYVIYEPQPVQHAVSLEEAITLIANWMGDWYTAAEAGERLVKLGAYNEPPSAKEICGWARAGLLPGARKVKGKGTRGTGQGGSWRIPGKALEALAEGRKAR